MTHWKGDEIRARINMVLPDGRVIPRHTKEGHFYEVVTDGGLISGIVVPRCPVYPSVTGKLQVLKDPSLINYKMNQALQYVFANFKSFNDSNIMEEIDKASRVSQDILEDAGDIGTRIHETRERIFNDWIKTGVRPTDFLSFIPMEEEDIRTTSAIRALQKFCIERDYIPVRCELLVYSHSLKVAGTLDDIGLMKHVTNEGIGFCGQKGPDGTFQPDHDFIVNEKSGKHTCVACGYQYRYELVLLDVKTSNQFKDHYFFQVALYWDMFRKLVGLKPERCFILKLSKEDGNYKIEDLKKPAKLAQYARAMLKTNEAIDFIRGLRKDNQKTVIKI